MKIVFVGKFFYPFFGGGEHYIKNVLEHLSNNGHECTALCFTDGATNQNFQESNVVKLGNIRVLQSKFCNSLQIQSVLKASRADVMITQSTHSMLFLEAAKQAGVKSVFGVHFYNEILSMSDGGHYINILDSSPERIKIDPIQQKPFRQADGFFVNSDFMAKVVEKYVGIKPEHIIYPPVNRAFICNEREPKHVTFVNPCIGKGMAIFRAVAKALPEFSFKMIGALVDRSSVNLKVYESLKELPNVEIVSNVDDMASVYKTTKVLLVPSVVDETFSMVTLEALFNGIPVLASKHGNLPYLLEKGGYCIDAEDTNSWVVKLKRLMTDNAEYERMVAESNDHAKKYDPEDQCKKFLKLLESVVSA